MNIFCPANLFKGYLKIADPPPPLKINSDHHIRNIDKLKKTIENCGFDLNTLNMCGCISIVTKNIEKQFAIYVIKLNDV